MRNQGSALRSPKGWGIWLVAAMVLAVIFLPAGAVGSQTELGSISGTVCYNASQVSPLEGAFVNVFPAGGGPWMGTALTGADGRYLIGGLPSGDYEIGVSLDGWAALSRPPRVTVTAPYETTGADLYLVPTPASVNGRVVSASGDPVGGVSITADNGSGFGRNTTTDPDGYFNIEGLPYGTYRVGCPAQGVWGPLEEQVWVRQEISGVVLSEAEPVAGGLLMTLQPAGFISGTVTGPDGQPLSGINIWADIDPQASNSYSFGRTDANGQYVLGGLPSGSYRVRAVGNPGYAQEYYLDSNWSGATLVPVTAGSETSGIDFALEPGGSISGRVLDLDGNPLCGLSVYLHERLVGIADANGAYSFSELPYGTYTLICPSRLWDPADWSWEQQVATVVLGPDTPDVVYDFFLAPFAVGLGSLSGTVYDNGSPPNPLEGASVYAFPAGGGPWMGTALTGADGRYLIGNLPSGDYEIGVSLDGWAALSQPPRVTITAPDATTGADLYLVPTPASVNGRVVSASGDPVGGVSITADNGSGFGRNTTTDPDGYFSIEGLTYGTYRVGCPAQGAWGPLEEQVWVRQEISGVVLSEAEPVAGGLLITLQPAGFISGTVTGPDGLPLSGINIWADTDPQASNSYSFGRTDANGQYVLGGLPSGSYRVRAVGNPGYAQEYYLDSNWSGATLVPVTAGSETSGIDFALEPGGSISGRVLDLDGNPLSGLSVYLHERLVGIADANGAYSFSELPYGTYTLICPSRLWDPADWSWEQQVATVVLGPDTPDVVYDFFLAPPAVVVSGTVKFTPTVLNLNSSADLRARIELEPGYSAGNIDLTTIRLESDLGVVAAVRAEVRRGLLWAWFDHDAVASILSVSDDLSLTVTGSLGSADLEAVGHLRVVAPRKSRWEPHKQNSGTRAGSAGQGPASVCALQPAIVGVALGAADAADLRVWRGEL